MSGPAHPVDGLADRYGDQGAALLLATVAVVPVFLLPDPAVPVWLGIAVVAYATSDGLDLSDDGRTELEEAKALYRHGDLTLEEFEARADLLLDERKQQVRTLSETVNGVGPATSADLAREFDSPDDLRRATPSDIEEIHGIGTETAERIASRVGEASEVSATESGPLTAERDTDPLAEPGGSR